MFNIKLEEIEKEHISKHKELFKKYNVNILNE